MLSAMCSNAQVLPAARSVNWSLAGYRGVIPDYTTVVNISNFGGAGNGTTPNDTAFTNAVNSLSGADGVIYFPSGTYLFNSSISMRSGLILRGFSSDSTKLKFDLGPVSTSNSINISGTAASTVSALTSNANKDSSFVNVADASGFTAGDYLKLSFNDSSILFSSWAYGTVGQIVKIASVAGNKIVLESPLRMDYDLSKNPKVTKLNMKTGVGIECLYIQRADATAGQTSNIAYNYAAQCWVSGIESYMCNFAHVEISSSTNISIKGSYFHEAFAYGGNGQGYGIACQLTSGECLTENNIFRHLRHSMVLQAGANGNVYCYNYSIDPYWTEPNLPSNAAGDMLLHGNYVYANLYEGNIGQNIVIDDSHGKNGPYNTYFRNRAELYGIFMNTNPASDNQNLIGNEITNAGFTLGNYYINGTGHFQFGNNVRGTIYASGTNTLPDVSYYYSSVPSFLQSMPNWPSVGIPRTINTGTIPAKDRYLAAAYTTCNSALTTHVIENNSADNGLKIFPNPADNRIYIQDSGNTNTPASIVIYDCLGNIAGRYSITASLQSIDLSSYARGIYIIKIETEGKNCKPQKLILQ